MFGILELVSLCKIVNVFDGWVSWDDPLVCFAFSLPFSLSLSCYYMGCGRRLTRSLKSMIKKKPCRSFNYFVHVKIGIVVFASHWHRVDSHGEWY